MLCHISFILFCVYYFLFIYLNYFIDMESKTQNKQSINYAQIDNLAIKENSYKDRLKECKRLLESEPQNIYLCANAKVSEFNLFTDDDKNDKVALQLADNLVQVFDNNERKLSNVLFDFQNNLVRIICENARLRPIKDYMANSIVLSTALVGAKVSFYQIFREGGKTHTLTNGKEYTADNSFFETVLLKVEVDEKSIDSAISYAIAVSK